MAREICLCEVHINPKPTFFQKGMSFWARSTWTQLSFVLVGTCNRGLFLLARYVRNVSNVFIFVALLLACVETRCAPGKCVVLAWAQRLRQADPRVQFVMCGIGGR